MKVKLKDSFEYVDTLQTDKEWNYSMVFSKHEVYEVVYQFKSDIWGENDHTVYVIINSEGEAMSISCEGVEIIQ